jgi:hypothetical protein
MFVSLQACQSHVDLQMHLVAFVNIGEVRKRVLAPTGFDVDNEIALYNVGRTGEVRRFKRPFIFISKTPLEKVASELDRVVLD